MPDRPTTVAPHDPGVGRFAWVDLAAANVTRAQGFYEQMFGWHGTEQSANGGHFVRLRLGDEDVGSMYQLDRRLLDQGVPSHWTPYVRVDDVEATAERAVTLGGAIVVRPLDVPGFGRIALIVDPCGALLGIWESVDTSARRPDHG